MTDRYTQAGDVDPFHTFQSSLDVETEQYDPDAAFYSLTDESYQRRAEILIPRAVGYSAGLMQHLFRGAIEAQWRRTSPGQIFSHELTITNRSSEKIGTDAEITAFYKATPAYFDRTNSDDAGTIFVKGDLAQFVPGFDGMDPGETVRFTVPGIFGLKDGDSIKRFERRIAITGTLGSEPDAVIGLVQPGYDKGLVFQLSWDGTFFLAAQIYDYPYNEGALRYTQACFNPNGLGGCLNPPSVPNSVVMEESSGTLAIGVDPIPAGATYTWKANHSQRVPKEVRAIVFHRVQRRRRHLGADTHHSGLHDCWLLPLTDRPRHIPLADESRRAEAASSVVDARHIRTRGEAQFGGSPANRQPPTANRFPHFFSDPAAFTASASMPSPNSVFTSYSQP